MDRETHTKRIEGYFIALTLYWLVSQYIVVDVTHLHSTLISFMISFTSIFHDASSTSRSTIYYYTFDLIIMDSRFSSSVFNGIGISIPKAANFFFNNRSVVLGFYNQGDLVLSFDGLRNNTHKENRRTLVLSVGIIVFVSQYVVDVSYHRSRLIALNSFIHNDCWNESLGGL